MPEMHFVVRWPDDSVMVCYSPSLVVREYFEAGCAYPLDEFIERSTAALEIASERVRVKFGFPCVRADRQLAQIHQHARTFERFDGAAVRVESFIAAGSNQEYE